MSDNDILAAFRQWTQAIAKCEKLQAEVGRLEQERTKAYTVLNDANEYAKRCESTVKELVKRGAKVPTPTPTPTIVDEARKQQASNIQTVVTGPVPTLTKPKAKG